MKHIPSSQYLSWKQILEEYGNVPWEKHWFEDKRYCLTVLKEKEYPVLTIGEKLKSQFMQHIDDENEQMVDLADEGIETGDLDLAQMSAVVFFPKYNSIGYITGAGRPKTAILETFLNTVVRDDRQLFEWQVVPIYTEDGLKEFDEKMESVHTVRFQFATQKSLLDGEEDGGELLETFQEFSNQLNTDITVDAKISIPMRLRTKEGMKKMKSMVSKAVPIISKQDKTVTVKGLTLDNTLIDFNILRHHMVLIADVPDSGKTRQFTQLIDTLIKVCSEQENEVYRLIER